VEGGGQGGDKWKNDAYELLGAAGGKRCRNCEGEGMVTLTCV